MDLEEMCREYLSLQREVEEREKKLAELKKHLKTGIEERGEETEKGHRFIVAVGHRFVLEQRVSKNYDMDRLREELERREVFHLAAKVDMARVRKLVKAGVVPQEAIDVCEGEPRVTKALVHQREAKR